MPRKRSASTSSARREISAWLWLLDDSASCMIGCADGSTRCSTGSRISVGSLWRTVPMALRTSSAASIMFLSKSKISTKVALPSRAVLRTSVHAGDALQRLLDAVDDLALDRLGLAPG
jgi:hypothetical protein